MDNNFWTTATGSNSSLPGYVLIRIPPLVSSASLGGYVDPEPVLSSASLGGSPGDPDETFYCFGKPPYKFPSGWPMLLPPWNRGYIIYNLDEEGYMIETCSYFSEYLGGHNGIYTGQYNCIPATEPHINYYTGVRRGDENPLP